jgi:hypothetical protein
MTEISFPIFYELVKSRKSTTNVIPAQAGIQKFQIVTKALDPGFRRGDDFLRVHHFWLHDLCRSPLRPVPAALNGLHSADEAAFAGAEVYWNLFACQRPIYHGIYHGIFII